VNTLRVSSQSDPGATAGAIANGVRESGEAVIHAIGPRAVNQAIKAIAIARGYIAASGVDLYFVPSFTNIHIAQLEHDKTAMCLAVRPRHAMTKTESASLEGGSIASS
jgi:stage V sporulation protein S